MSLTKKEILELRDGLVAETKASKLPPLTDSQLVQGVRTLVHSILQEASPMPHLMPDPEPGKSDAEYADKARIAAAVGDTNELRRLHLDHVVYKAQRVALAKASVPPEVHAEFLRMRPPLIGDAHHYAQMLHGKKIWEEADKLVTNALGGDK
jgi:hypothetical protein